MDERIKNYRCRIETKDDGDFDSAECRFSPKYNNFLFYLKEVFIYFHANLHSDRSKLIHVQGGLLFSFCNVNFWVLIRAFVFLINERRINWAPRCRWKWRVSMDENKVKVSTLRSIEVKKYGDPYSSDESRGRIFVALGANLQSDFRRFGLIFEEPLIHRFSCCFELVSNDRYQTRDPCGIGFRIGCC